MGRAILSVRQAPAGLINADAQLVQALDRYGSDPDHWSSKKRDRSDSAHCIFQYPAMMVPLVQRRLLEAVMEAQPQARSLYDPFVGSGTSLVSGMHYGLDVYGNDVNPLAVLISRTRTARDIELHVGQVASEVVAQARADQKMAIESTLINLTKWFKPSVAVELSRLRRAIRACGSLWSRRFMWVTLAETVRLTSNDRTSTYKLHARPLDEIDKRILSPIDVFSDLAIQNAKSFTAFRNALRKSDQLSGTTYVGCSDVQIADSCDNVLTSKWTAESFDILMTSPPYGDNRTTVTYGQHSYLPLHWIDFADIDSSADPRALCTTHEIDRRSLGGELRYDESAVEALFNDSSTLKRFSDSLPNGPSQPKSRLLSFYADFRTSLASMTTKVALNGYMIWTVGNRSLSGNQVPTDVILGEMLEAQGCTLVSVLTRSIHHKRMAARNASATTMKEEKILLVRKSG